MSGRQAGASIIGRMEYVTGYFTVERNIVGSSLREMESKLGLRPGRLTDGARVLALVRQPSVGEFVFAGSTLYSDAKGLVEVGRRGNVPIPHAWLGQRLVKVVPNLPHSPGELYPAAKSPVEQWQLLVPVAAEEVCQLDAQQVYWRRRWSRGQSDDHGRLDAERIVQERILRRLARRDQPIGFGRSLLHMQCWKYHFSPILRITNRNFPRSCVAPDVSEYVPLW